MHLAKRVSAKLEDGDYRGAVRVACCEDTFADITDETLRVLQENHSPAHPESHIPPPPEEEVTRAIRSFPRGSAGGPDGIRPQHLLDLTSASALHGGEVLLRALAVFINHALAGNVPQPVQPVFFGATLIPLRKKEGGVRPIAVG